MRRFWTSALLAVAIAMPGSALAGDKSQSTLVNPGVTGTGAPVDLGTKTVASGVWTNASSKGKTQGDDKCKVQIQLSKITLPDTDGIAGTGDEVICVSDSKITLGGAIPLNTTAVFRGEVKKGTVKIKADLNAEGTGCIPSKKGGPGIASYESRTVCYTADAAYPAPPIGFASDSTQGIYPAGFGPHPSSSIIAADGIYFIP